MPPPPMPVPAPPDFRELAHDGDDVPGTGECDREMGSTGVGDREPLGKYDASSLLLLQVPLLPIRGVWGIGGSEE